MPRSKIAAASALPLVFAAALIAGCQSPPMSQAPAPDAVLAGSTFVSTNALTLPAGVAEVVLQNASVVAESALQRDYPYCRFRPGGAVNSARVIAPPSVYSVTSLDYDESGSRRGNETRPVVWFNLQGGPQDAGGRMGCAVPFLAPNRLFLTPAEVQGAVGRYFNVNAAP